MSEPVLITAVGNAETIGNLGFRLGDYRVAFSERAGKIEIFNVTGSDPPHLTIFWGTKSGELDIHLTLGHEQALAGGPPKRYESIVKIARPDLEQLGAKVRQIAERTLVPRLMAAYRRFRPGWLGHRGYVVVFVEGDDLLEWLRRAAPRIRGKYQIRPEQIVDSVNYPPGLLDSVYCSSLLDEIRAIGSRVSVSAVRLHKRPSARDQITLNYTMGPDGTIGWWGAKHSALGPVHQACGMMFAELAVSLLGPDPASKVESVLTGLGVEDGRRREIVQTLTTIVSQHTSEDRTKERGRARS